jgi:hypothetical protein
LLFQNLFEEWTKEKKTSKNWIENKLNFFLTYAKTVEELVSNFPEIHSGCEGLNYLRFVLYYFKDEGSQVEATIHSQPAIQRTNKPVDDFFIVCALRVHKGVNRAKLFF